MSDQEQNNFSTSFIVVFTTIKNCSSPVLPRLVRQRTTRDPRIYSGRSSTEASITPWLKLNRFGNTLLGKASRCCQLSLVAGPTALRSLPCVYDQRTSRRRKNLGFTQEAANLVCRHYSLRESHRRRRSSSIFQFDITSNHQSSSTKILGS